MKTLWSAKRICTHNQKCIECTANMTSTSLEMRDVLFNHNVLSFLETF